MQTIINQILAKAVDLHTVDLSTVRKAEVSDTLDFTLVLKGKIPVVLFDFDEDEEDDEDDAPTGPRFLKDA